MFLGSDIWIESKAHITPRLWRGERHLSKAITRPQQLEASRQQSSKLQKH